MKTISLLPTIYMLAISFLSSAQESKYSFKETYKVAPPAKMTIFTSDGDIDVVNSPGNEIEVFFIARRDRSVLEMSRELLEKEVVLEISYDMNSLNIRIKNRPEISSRLFEDDIDVSLEIHAPAETRCELSTSDGNISLAGFAGDQQFKTSDGDIRVAEVDGNITGKSSDGDIILKSIKGSVDVATSDGNINLSNIIGNVQSSTSDGDIVVQNVKGNTSSKTSDGHITFEGLSGSFSGVTSDGNIKGSLLQLSTELTARTGDGNINISVPGNLGLDLDIKGESLNVPLNNFSGRSDEESILGESNGGGIPVRLHTSDGRIALAYQ